ncbi:DUF2203 domain-containing protein [Terriglobus sp.]|uniref:DUF2203 domain-containing protein n=1 Tax=Terriglobus sp. TaxID=1889013 RepID=UPI003B006382
MRTFTLPEAQTLLPVLSALLERAQTAAGTAAARETTLQSLHQAIFLNGGMHIDLLHVARLKGEQERAVAEARDSLQEIDDIGVSVKDLQHGLLEFPFQLDEEVVLLCWEQGQSTITTWRTTEQDPSDRQPLDDRFTRPERPH